MWRQDDDKEATAEVDKPQKSIVAAEKPKETKEGEREDLITQFDRIIRGEFDSNSQVRVNPIERRTR